MSERGDVFYHPDLHTHTSCVRETSNCQLFVLIIGGRFGGTYVVDPAKSITNAEYSAAIQNGTPVFTFVKQDVLNDHNVWQRNKNQPFVNQIDYPSIERAEHAEEIFKFIDSVRQAPVNNGIFGFRVGRDIHDTLRKQWAAMLFEYLQNRTIAKQIALTNDALGNLSIVSGKIEELVKNIYRNVDSAGANLAIENIDNESLAEEFLLTLSKKIVDKKFISETSWESSNGYLPASWWDFLKTMAYADIKIEKLDDGTEVTEIQTIGGRMTQRLSGPLTREDEIEIQSLQSGYKKLLSLPAESRTRLASKYFWTKADSASAVKAREAAQMALSKIANP